jgi:hypothetical protein
MKKSALTKGNLTIIIFPYLFIHLKKGIEIGNINIKANYKSNINKESKTVKSHLTNISNMFQIRGNKTNYWSYAVTHLGNDGDWEHLKLALFEFATILRFYALTKIEDYSGFEAINYFIFEINDVETELTEDYVYYKSVQNGEVLRSHYLKDNKIDWPIQAEYPYSPFFLDCKDLFKQDFFKILSELGQLYISKQEQRKIIRAISWYNQSYAYKRIGIDIGVSILNIHTALEALLRLEDPKGDERNVSAQLKGSLCALLGQTEEIRKWYGKFADIRNQLTHGDKLPDSYLYIHPESSSKIGHRNHLQLSRKIFVKCLNAILLVRQELLSWDLQEELISNEIRIKKATPIIKEFNKQNGNIGSLSNELYPYISTLQADDLSATKLNTHQFGKLILSIVKADLHTENESEDSISAIRIIDDIEKFPKGDYRKLALLYSELHRVYHNIYFTNDYVLPKRTSMLNLLVNSFTEFAAWRLLTSYGQE